MAGYVATAAVLGVGWFAVLLLPSLTRGWLLESTLRNLVFLVGTSVIVALTFRRFITDAETFGSRLVRALTLPYAGCVIYLSVVAAWSWIRQLLFGGLTNLHDTLSLYAMGLTAALLACFVVVPYGLACQYVMSAAAERIDLLQ